MKRPYPPRVDATPEEMAQAMLGLPADHKWEYQETEPEYRCSDCGREVHYPETLFRDGRCKSCYNGHGLGVCIGRLAIEFPF